MNRESNSKFDLFAVLLLLCAFSVAVLSLLLTGAGTYKGITQEGRAAQDMQTEALYISQRVFSARSWEDVSAARYGGTDCLEIKSEAGGETWVTRVYCHDGWLMELFSVSDMPFDPAAGEKVAKASSLTVTRTDELLNVRLETESGVSVLPFARKGGGK